MVETEIPQRLHGPFQVDRVPQHDGGHHPIEAAGAIALVLEAAVADFAQPVHEHGAGQRVPGLALVQAGLRAAPQSGVQSSANSVRSMQFHAYRAVLDKALLTIQQHPQIGRGRPELSAAHLIFPAGQHLIIYRAGDAAVYVSRILHGSMGIGRHAV